MKLLMITGLGSAKDLVSGKKGAFYNTLEEFHKYWTRIDIICPRINNIDFGNSKSQIQNPKQIPNSKLQTKILFDNVYLHVSPWPLIFHPIWFLKKGLQIYKEQKFDLMTVHEFPPFYNGIGARLLWQKIKVPYLLEIFHVPGHPRSATIKEEIYKNLMRIFIAFDSSKAKAIRIMNKQVGLFLKESGIPAEKIRLIPAVYADLDVFKPEDVPKKYDLIFIGRLVENKGINLLLEAIKNLKHQIPNIKCLIVGNGPLLNHCKLEIINWKLQDNVLLYGWAKDQKEIAQLLNESKILAMPSYNEGGPRVVVEALACGIPVLATSVGIVPDIIKDNQLGKIIDWEGDDIAKKAQEILNNYEVYRNTGLETVKQFEKKAAIKNYADKLKEFI